MAEREAGVARCLVCNDQIEYNDPTGDGLASWWSHEHHPEDGHEAVAGGASRPHSWTDPTDLVHWEHCSVCGIIRRRDRGNDGKPCPGPKPISLRTTSDEAADPLADVRARGHNERDMSQHPDEDVCRVCLQDRPCDAERALATLDAERVAHAERLAQVDVGWERHSAVLRERAMRAAHDQANREIERLGVEVNRQRERAEQHEAVITQAPWLLEGYVQDEARKHREDRERGGCTCGFCAWSPEHVVIVSVRDAWPRVVADLGKKS